MQLTHKESILFLEGAVTVATLNQAHQRLLAQACQNPIQAVDLSGVTQADSACVAVLIAIKRHLGKQTWQLRSVPEAVTVLLGLYELDWLA